MTASPKKEQHYLPRFYLRGFSTDAKRRMVSLFNIQRGLYVPSATIKDEARGSSIYGRDGVIENALMLLETGAADIFSKMHHYRCAPTRYSLEQQLVLTYILAQRRRTPRAGQELIDAINVPLALAFREDPRYKGLGDKWVITPENPVAVSVGWSIWRWPLLLDLSGMLLVTDLEPGFVTSDSPVIYYNQYLEEQRPYLSNVGLLTRGLQIFLPLSPGALLALYDGAIYKVGERGVQNVSVTCQADLDALNALQAASAERNLYFSSSVPPEYVRALVRDAQTARKSYKTEASEYRSTSDPSRGMVHVRAPEIRTGLALSFIGLHRRVRRMKVGTGVLMPRDSETWELIHEFETQVEHGDLGHEDLHLFLASRGKLRPTVQGFPGRTNAQAKLDLQRTGKAGA